MEEDTIVTDVIEKPLSQRELATQAILAASREPVEVEEEVVEEEEVVKEPPQDEEITLVVDGTELKTSKDKVVEAGIRALQKESAAEKRLWEASAKEKELNRRAEELARMEQELLAKRDQQPDQVGREFADAIFTDPETVAKTVSTIARKVQEVSDKVESAQKIEVEKQKSTMQVVFDHYLTTYKDIAGDDDMHEAANRRFRKIAEQRTPTIADVDQIAKDVYGKFGVSTEPEVEKIDPAAERKMAKENMPAPIKRASARTPPAPVEKPKTPSQIIDEMRKGRGPRAY